MDNIIKYAHVGYPKADSSWLQHELFSKHPDLYHLGKFNGSEFVSHDVELLLGVDCVNSPKFLYNPDIGRQILSEHIDIAQQKGKKAIVFSHELFTHYYFGNVDISDKCQRVNDFMGSDTRIIIVIREQLAWIKSFYSGSLTELGITNSFDEFYHHFFYEQDRSGFSSLFFDNSI